MTPKSIGSVLKYYRKLRNLSVNDVSLYLSENNSSASPKTIYGWENDHTEPNLHTLVLLCHLYEIDDILNWSLSAGTESTLPSSLP